MSNTRKFNTPYEKGYTAKPEKPEGVVGFEKSVILDIIAKSKFSIEKFIPGYWKTKRTSLDQHEQDVFVLLKKH